MKRIALILTITLTAFLSIYSQTVDESKTLARFEKNDLVTKLRITSDAERSSKVDLKLINPNNSVIIEQTNAFDLRPGAGGTEFDFKFKPRYGINAQTPASVVYDYYNEEAKAIVKPKRFVVR